jgi:hypothetical protein
MKNIFQIIILAGFMTILSGCKKEGCTDNTAKNFDPKAKKSNNTCQFESSVVFWYGKDVANSAKLSGITSFRFYVDNELIGSTASDVYWTGAPDCGQNGSMTATKDLGGSKSKAFEYSVRDQLNVERWKGVINFEAGVCLTQELAL